MIAWIGKPVQILRTLSLNTVIQQSYVEHLLVGGRRLEFEQNNVKHTHIYSQRRLEIVPNVGWFLWTKYDLQLEPQGQPHIPAAIDTCLRPNPQVA